MEMKTSLSFDSTMLTLQEIGMGRGEVCKWSIPHCCYYYCITCIKQCSH